MILFWLVGEKKNHEQKIFQGVRIQDNNNFVSSHKIWPGQNQAIQWGRSYFHARRLPGSVGPTNDSGMLLRPLRGHSSAVLLDALEITLLVGRKCPFPLDQARNTSWMLHVPSESNGNVGGAPHDVVQSVTCHPYRSCSTI